MSASHIPNLNTLRRGGGRGRLRARGRGPPGNDEDSHGTSDSNHSSDSKDRVVQGTDNDASVSRLSAVNLGYIDDPFARALAPSTLETRRLPIINRGTYVRTAAIDRLVDRFLGQDQDQQKQIISLGAGSDTRVFRLLSSSSHRRNIVYHEIDFPVNTAAKIKAIRATRGLQSALGMDKLEETVIVESGDALHSPEYHLHPLDLRCLSRQDTPGQEPEPGPHLEGVDATLPTLLISECCLVYLSPAEADGVVDYFTRTLFPPKDSTATPLGLILYEPIRPDDPFGRTMVSNLAARGIQLQTLHRYASLDSQRERLQRHGFADGQDAADVDFLWERWVSEGEKERVGGLEMLDEIEEWQLLARHYCVAWGWRGLDGWREIETPCS